MEMPIATVAIVYKTIVLPIPIPIPIPIPLLQIHPIPLLLPIHPILPIMPVSHDLLQLGLFLPQIFNN